MASKQQLEYTKAQRISGWKNVEFDQNLLLQSLRHSQARVAKMPWLP